MKTKMANLKKELVIHVGMKENWLLRMMVGFVHAETILKNGHTNLCQLNNRYVTCSSMWMLSPDWTTALVSASNHSIMLPGLDDTSHSSLSDLPRAVAYCDCEHMTIGLSAQ